MYDNRQHNNNYKRAASKYANLPIRRFCVSDVLQNYRLFIHATIRTSVDEEAGEGGGNLLNGRSWTWVKKSQYLVEDVFDEGPLTLSCSFQPHCVFLECLLDRLTSRLYVNLECYI